MHSEVREKQGVAAQAAWSEVDLKAVFKAERVALDKLLAQELATQQRVSKAIRDQQLTAMLRADRVATVIETVETRLIGLVGKDMVETARPFSAFERSLQARDDLARAVRARQQQESVNFLPMGEALPDCQEIRSNVAARRLAPKMAMLSPNNRADVEQSLKKLADGCAKEAGMAGELYGGAGGLLGQVVGQYRADKEALASSKQAFLEGRADYAEALLAYQAAVKQAQPHPSLNARVVAAAKDLGVKLKRLDALQTAHSKELVARERLAALEIALAEIAESKDGAASEGASKSSAALITLPHLLGQARDVFYTDRPPAVAALLIRRNFEQLQLDAASRDVRSRERVVELSKEIVDVTYGQAERVHHAWRDLQRIPASARSKPLRELLATSKPAVKAAAYRALAYYFDSTGRLSAKRYQLEYMRVAAMHERSLAYAEVNAEQWASLIGFGVEEVAVSSAGGIKGSMIGAAISSLGILGTAYGVNK